MANNATEPDVTIEREIAEVVRGSGRAPQANPSGDGSVPRLFSEVLDPDSFRAWNSDHAAVPAGPEYLAQLAEARRPPARTRQ